MPKEGRMRELTIGTTRIADDTPAYVIAELGHNHGGSLDTALRMVDAAADAGVNAVKLQKRDNRTLYTPAAFDAPYNSPHAYGRTYGEHREALELTIEQHAVVAWHARERGLHFICTPFDAVSAAALHGLPAEPDAYKIASADLINIPLIQQVASYGRPVIISTGGGTLEDVHRVCRNLDWDQGERTAFLHCTASYPCRTDMMNLAALRAIAQDFPANVLGLSDHHAGTDLAPIAYVLGARIFEKHFTLDQDAKGTDNAFSLLPGHMRRMVHLLAEAREAMGDGVKRVYPEEVAPLAKMAKSVYAARDLKTGDVLTAADLKLCSPAVEGAVKPYDLDIVVGKRLLCGVPAHFPLLGVFLG